MNIRSARALLLATSLLAVGAPVNAEPPAEFVESVGTAAGFHRALSRLVEPGGRYPGDADLAFDRYQELTLETLDAQQDVEIHACFADWWAYEFMGLQLTAASQTLRRVDPTAVREADIVEQLGRRMFYQARDLFPVAADRCQDVG